MLSITSFCHLASTPENCENKTHCSTNLNFLRYWRTVALNPILNPIVHRGGRLRCNNQEAPQDFRPTQVVITYTYVTHTHTHVYINKHTYACTDFEYTYTICIDVYKSVSIFGYGDSREEIKKVWVKKLRVGVYRIVWWSGKQLVPEIQKMQEIAEFQLRCRIICILRALHPEFQMLLSMVGFAKTRK